MNRLPNGNIEIPLTIPWPDIQKQFEVEVEKTVADFVLPGFRKGKAPKELVEPKMDKSHLYTHAVEKLLPLAYAAAIKKHGLRPILHPQVRLVKNKVGENWEFLAVTCELPQITLPDYQAHIKKLKVDKPDEKLTVILTALRDLAKPAIPDLLVEEEANHRLSLLVENASKLGLTIDGYLASKKITSQDLRAQTAAEARTQLEFETILEYIKRVEKLENRQKTLDHLLHLI